VRECGPMARVDSVSVAVPLLRVPVPSDVDPSLNVTVPVAANGETVAVSATLWPKVEGFGDEVRPEEVPAGLTVCVSARDVLAASFARSEERRVGKGGRVGRVVGARVARPWRK